MQLAVVSLGCSVGVWVEVQCVLGQGKQPEMWGGKGVLQLWMVAVGNVEWRE